jgi:hypothetical protein
MERLDATSTSVLRDILRDQPLTEAKVAFAWRVAAGPALARAATVSWSATGTLVVRADSSAWRLEVVRAKSLIAERLGVLLGRDVVRRIQVVERDQAGRHPRVD